MKTKFYTDKDLHYFLLVMLLLSLFNFLPYYYVPRTLITPLEINRSAIPYYFTADCICLFLSFFINKRLLIKLCAVSCFALLAFFNYTSGIPDSQNQTKTFTPKKKLKIFYTNVKFNNTNREALREQIIQQDPDIVALAEMTRSWRKEFNISDIYPYKAEYTKTMLGLQVYSKFPIMNSGKIWGEDLRPLLAVQINLLDTKEPFYLNLVHFSAPYSTQNLIQRNSMFTTVTDFISKQPASLSLGDFNTTQFSPPLHKLVESTQANISSAGHFFYYTWCDDALPLFCAGIDHIIYKGNIRLTNFTKLPSTGSDHIPILAEVEVG